jgi:cytochrome P450
MILINVMNIHRNPEHWGTDADRFVPERFATDKIKDGHPFAYLPFTGENFSGFSPPFVFEIICLFRLTKQGGPRLCLAYKYGMLSIKLFLAHIIRSFEVSTDLKYEDIELDIPIILKIKQGYNMSLRRREGCKT